MAEHEIEIETMPALNKELVRLLGGANPGRYRWRCSRGRSCTWKSSRPNVRWGAARHLELAARAEAG